MVFNEDFSKPQNKTCGSIEVICGCMFAGKTEELMRRIEDARIAGLDIQIFKPAIDTRYDENAIVSHNLQSIPCIAIDRSAAILSLYNNAQVVAIDEAQFFDNDLPRVCTTLANNGVRIIVAGLDTDFKNRPFHPMPAVISIATSVTTLYAVCAQCDGQAQHTYRLVPGDEQILLGETETYEPRCPHCFNQ